ncbi:MAG: AMP-binding protein, partial [Psychrosphaera sp.]|nr:AMP-binding protein [Psychrosphaera sp.]
VDIADILKVASLKELALKVRAQGEDGDRFIAPKNLITSESGAVTTAQLNLIDLSAEQLNDVVAHVPGGIDNIEDIYSLSPLQEGMLFHHITSVDEDIYLSTFTLQLDNEGLLNQLIEALTTLVSRHDTMRTIFFWEGLPEPAQVVLKQAELVVKYVELNEYHSADEARVQLEGYREHKMPMQSGPLMQLKVGKCATKSAYFVLVEHHHLIMDHIGLDIMVEELGAIISQKPQALIPPTPYRNVVAYAKAQNSDGKGEAYFKQKFADFDEATVLFNADIDCEGLEYVAKLDVAAGIKLRQQALETGLGIAAIFHVAWALVAAKCASTQDVAFGTVLSGRLNDYTITHSTMCLAINYLPLRISLDQYSVREVLAQTAQHLQELVEVEQTPMVAAVSQMSSNNMFNCVLNYRHSDKMLGQNKIIDGLTILDAWEQTNFSITVDVDDYGLAGDFNITVHTLNGVSGQQIHGYFCNAIEKVLDTLEHSPNTVLTDLGIVAASEIEHIIDTINDTSMDYAKDKCIHQLFEQQALDHPDNVALAFENQQLSYQQLNEKANQLAHYLREHHDITPDTLVGLCVERSLEMVIGILAILKAGGAYVPLDPAYPQERLQYMCDDAQLEVILSQTEAQAVLVDFNGATVMLDGLADSNEHLCSEYANSNLTLAQTGLISSNLAYVIYTSGSTGNPKGVLQTHHNVNRLFACTQDDFEFDHRDCWCLFHSVSFDFSVWELWGALLYGGKLLVATRSEV